jgi:type I restriction enzyme S subunit
LISVEYVRLAISSPNFLDALLELHKGIGAKHVNVGDMREAVIPVPPVAEQLRIVERVADLTRLCATLRERLQAQQATQSRLAEALVEQATA